MEEFEKICFEKETYNTKLVLGNLYFYTDKKINIFHKILFRLLLGIKVERMGENERFYL